MPVGSKVTITLSVNASKQFTGMENIIQEDFTHGNGFTTNVVVTKLDDDVGDLAARYRVVTNYAYGPESSVCKTTTTFSPAGLVACSNRSLTVATTSRSA